MRPSFRIVFQKYPIREFLQYEYSIGFGNLCMENINNLLPQYELRGVKAEYGRVSHESVKQALRRFNKFLMQEGR